MTDSTVKSRSFIGRRIDEIYAYTALILLGFVKLNKNTVSLYYSSYTIPAIIIYIIRRIKGGIFLKEENEHPSVRLRRKNSFEKILFIGLHYGLFDGYLLISNALIKYFENRVSRTKPTLHVPIMIDFKIFEGKILNEPRKNEVVYSGAISFKKEGVDVLIKAF